MPAVNSVTVSVVDESAAIGVAEAVISHSATVRVEVLLAGATPLAPLLVAVTVSTVGVEENTKAALLATLILPLPSIAYAPPVLPPVIEYVIVEPLSISVATAAPIVAPFDANTGKMYVADGTLKLGGSLTAVVASVMLLFDVGVVMPSLTVIVNRVPTERPGST